MSDLATIRSCKSNILVKSERDYQVWTYGEELTKNVGLLHQRKRGSVDGVNKIFQLKYLVRTYQHVATIILKCAFSYFRERCREYP